MKYRPISPLYFATAQDPRDAEPPYANVKFHCEGCRFTGGQLGAYYHSRATGHVTKPGPRPLTAKDSSDV